MKKPLSEWLLSILNSLLNQRKLVDFDLFPENYKIKATEPLITHMNFLVIEEIYTISLLS